MSTVCMLRDQLRQAHQFLDGAVADITADQSQWQPAGMANPLGATYAHVLVGEDAFVAMLRRTPPLFADEWVGRTGVTPLPPLSPPGSVLPLDQNWHEWGRRVRVDLPSLRTYGQAVQQVADAYLASLNDRDLDQQINLSAAGFGNQSLAWLLSSRLVAPVLSHWGEIACIKGLQGDRGFPI